MTEIQESTMAILVNAHCSLKLFYQSKGKDKNDTDIQKEIMSLFCSYADSDFVFSALKSGVKE